MKSPTPKSLAAQFVLGVLLAGLVQPLWAGGTPSGQLFMPQGSDSGTANGDYITTGAIDTYYSYFVEVPAGATRLVVDLFDADWGAGGAATEAAANRDRDRGASTFGGNSSYSLLNPAGGTVVTTDSDSFGADNAWSTLFDSSLGVPGSAPTFVSVSTAITGDNDTSTNLSLALPGSTVGTDLLLAFIAKDQEGSVSAVTAPAGWTLVNEGGCDSNECALSIFRRFASGAAGAQNFTWSGGQRAVGAIAAYRGVDATTPLDVAATVVTQASGDPTAPAITTVTANTRIIRTVVERDDLAPFDTPGGHTERFDLERDSGGNNQMVSSAMADTTQATAGLNAAATFADDGTSENSRGVTIALRPISTPGGAPTAGHWEVRINNTASGSNDINAIGIRGHDGNSGAGGTEFPVYYDSHTQIGANTEAGANSAHLYNVFPYMTSGCTAQESDFDFDRANGTGGGPGGIFGRIILNSRNGAFNQTISGTISVDDTWASTTINQWTTDNSATGYGIWPSTYEIWPYSGGNSNYANIYIRNVPASGAPPPTAQPTPNTFRVYLPTDAAGTPVKPYLEQILTYQGGAGPNPPVPLTMSLFRVTVRMVNPTAQAITFSTPTNIITANVPGVTALYGGGAVATAGTTIVSQPTVGLAGDVTWNPGTLAAGATAILSYLVRVTPTLPAQRVVATGTPALNGTRGQYRDETGNATQARALYLHGPLCELAVTAGLLTKALVTDLRAVSERGQVAVEWSTTTEDGTAGFDLFRWSEKANDWVLVNEEIVVAAPDSTHGAKYRVVDRDANAKAELRYSLIEHEVTGSTREAGRFSVRAEAAQGDERFQRADDVERIADQIGRSEIARLRAESPERLAEARVESFRTSPATALKILVRERGLYRISPNEIASRMGITVAQATARIQSGQIRIENGGQQVSWHSANVGGVALYFFGDKLDSIYSRDNVYRLTLAAGQKMATANVGAGPGAGSTSFVDRLDVETDAFAGTVVATDPGSDYWYWTYLVGDDAQDGTRALGFQLADPIASGTAQIELRLQGATSSGVEDEHEAIVRLNGIEIGSTAWTGITAKTLTLDVTPSLLVAGTNTLEIDGHRGGAAPLSVFYVDGFRVTSTRATRAINGRLELTGGGATTVRVTELTAPSAAAVQPLQLFDLTNARTPRVVRGALVEKGGAGIRFNPATPTTPYLAQRLEAALTPYQIVADSPSNLRGAKGADLVIVADAALAGSAQSLANYRIAQGLSATVVKLEDVYDEFNAGVASPLALRSFFEWAATEWATPAKYAVLVGDGTFDYKNWLGVGGNRMPVMMVASPSGLFASDSAFGDFDGDGLSEISVGRLPVVSTNELAAVIQKIQAYETSPGDWAKRLVLLADNADGGARFDHESDALLSSTNREYDVTKIYLDDMGASEANDATVAAFQQGAGFLSFIGHGGIDRMAAEPLLASADVTDLANSGRAPFTVALSCAVNRFEHPGFPALGEELVRRANGGSVAVFAPSGLSQSGPAVELSSRLSYELLESNTERAGDALLNAQLSFVAAGGDVELLRLYTLIGDPTLRLRRAAMPTPPPGSSTGE